MKKKRFIKLLMGAGFSRNTAATVAKATAITGNPKAVVLLNILAAYDFFISSGARAEEVKQGLLEAAKEIVQGGACNA